ncbi:MAG: tetratricopeptide repeat protein [Alphaproteobacteria bacterium]|nr:tetratricopeptide repeat protein [Alphaproteobacteria bacterium]
MTGKANKHSARASAAAEDQLVAANAAFGRRDFAEAERLLRVTLAATPRHAGALHLLGATCAQTGRHEEAVTLVRQAIGLAPRDASAHNTLGIALRRLGRFDEAIAVYEKALALDPKLVDALGQSRPRASCPGPARRVARALRGGLATAPKVGGCQT